MPPPARRPPAAANLRLIASRAGVSIATVSRILHQDPRHSAATRARVLAIAGELGYHQHPLVSALMEQVRRGRVTEMHGTIALLTPHSTRDAWRTDPGSPVFQRFYDGMARRAAWRGYRLQELTLEELGRKGARISDVLWHRGITGLVFLPSPTGLDFSDLELDWERFSGAVLGSFMPHPPLHRACSHNLQGMMLTCQTLAARGYSRLGLHVTDRSDEQIGHNWIAGFACYQQTIPPADRVPIILARDWQESPVKWIRHAGVDAVITVDANLRRRLRAAGFGVPRDLGVAMLDWNPPFGDLAGIDQRPERTGEAVVDLVVDSLSRHERGLPEAARTVLVDGVWQEGTSLRPGTNHETPRTMLQLRQSGVFAQK